MADAPVIFKRTKTKATQRARSARNEDNALPPSGPGAESDDGDTESASALAAKLRKQQKARAKPKAALSFRDEEEGDGEVFQVKKSNLSKKLTLGKAASGSLLPATLDQATISPRNGGPTYSAAYLSELKASTAGSRPRPQTSESYDVDMSIDAPNLPDTPSALVDLSGDIETAIPSESSIAAAKQKRERLRTAPSSADDFISLSLTKRDDVPQGPHPDSRLMREEDEMGEGEDEFAEYTSAQERIALGKKSRKVEAKKKREAMKEMIADAEDEDEETVEWENEQLRRGGHTADDQLDPEAGKPVYRPAPIPQVVPIPTLGPAIARLTQSLTSLTTSHAASTTTMTALAEERLQLEAREQEMREMIVKAEEKRSWFAEFREWVESVATFLDEKFPLLEKLEDEHVSLLKERHEMTAKRRRLDDEDDMTLFLGALPPSSAEVDESDDLGRIVPRANPSVLRHERRQSRIARRTRRTQPGPKATDAEEEGFSSDSSLSPSDAADYSEAQHALASRARAITADVRAPEFQDPRRGLARRFGAWRERHGEEYTGAWGGLGMVAAWEFWARLESIGWNPLADGRTLDEFGWYLALYEYSRPRSSGEDEGEEGELGPEGDLAAAMVATAAVPRLCAILEGGALDVYSARDVRRLVDLAEQVEASVERGHLKHQMFLKSALAPFRTAVTDMENALAPFLALNQPRFDPEAIPARRRVLTRQRKLLSNILRWRKYTGDLFGIGQLATRLVENCVLPVAESGWEVGGEECVQKIVNVIPAEFIPANLKARLLR